MIAAIGTNVVVAVVVTAETDITAAGDPLRRITKRATAVVVLTIVEAMIDPAHDLTHLAVIDDYR